MQQQNTNQLIKKSTSAITPIIFRTHQPTVVLPFPVLLRVAGEAAAEDMGHHGDVVPVLDGGSHGDSARATAERYLVEHTLGRLLVHILAAVGGDIDVSRVKLAQLVDRAEQAVDACALERRQYLEGECRACSVGDRVYDAHVSEELKVKSKG